MSKKKWEEGGIIYDFWSFVQQDIVFWNGKAYSTGWIKSQPFNMVYSNFLQRRYRYAVSIKMMVEIREANHGK